MPDGESSAETPLDEDTDAGIELPPHEPDPLQRMFEDIRAFVAERSWEPFHDPKNLAMAVVSEAGELAAELRWIAGEDADAHCQDLEARQRVADEIADVLITTLMLADRIGLDVPTAVFEKLAKNRLKYPPGSP